MKPLGLHARSGYCGAVYRCLFMATLVVTLLLPKLAQAQDQSNDILLVSVGESFDRYSDVAVHLQGLMTNASGWSDVQVDIFENSTIESLADGYYDQNAADIALRAKVVEGYDTVILIPTIIQAPTKTIEYGEYGGGPTNVYDDAPFDNEYFAPEVFYEGCTQFSKLILSTVSSTPMIFLPDNADEDVSVFGPIMYRVASGVGMDLIPGAYALDAAGVTTAAEEDYLYACAIFTQLTGLNATASTYSPAGISGGDATTLGNTAETTVNLHATTVHYTTSYENDGAVVYRSLDVTSTPFNSVVRYRYKGSSTHDWTSDALTKIINSDNTTANAAFRKLGIKSNGYSGGTRYWHPDDFLEWANTAETVTQGDKIAYEPDQAAFMYVSGSWQGADAQDVIDANQSNMIPMAFDWIKSFAISPAVSGTASTLDALDYHDCNELYFNYAERGWKLIPLTIGMGRINEATTNFVASEDALHGSDLLVYMNAYMMLSSSLGMQFPLITELVDGDIHRGSHTVEEVNQACLIGHDIIKELAYLSETGGYVPESDLEILTGALPEVPLDDPYSFQLSATGGDTSYTWELISDSGLPDGLSLSSSGLLSGTVTEGSGTWSLVFRVTDGVGAFRKVGLKLTTALPVGDVAGNADIVAEASVDYGTDAVAIMYSPVLTAPDQLATFRIAINVDPMAGASIVSLASGTWGIKSGVADVTRDTTFDGSLGESVDSISNIHVVDFNANGGGLTINSISDLSFQSVAVYSANHGRDRVQVAAGGNTTNYTGTALATSPATIDLQALAGSTAVSSFTIANGSANDANRWNVGSIQVNFTIQMPSDESYASWASGYGLVDDDALADADVENGGVGDGYANLLEFALGMDPTIADAGSKESMFTEEEGAFNYFVYEYERRTDYMDQGLTYTLVMTPDLATPSLDPPYDVSIGDPVDGFQTITTRYLIDGDSKFVHLQVEVE
ncbi:MAG: hypothetical protein ACSHX4_08320 [Opitutaceae bacterium]